MFRKANENTKSPTEAAKTEAAKTVKPETDADLRKKINKRLELYADSGIRYYLRRLFSMDPKIVKDLDAIGAQSELARLDKENNDQKLELSLESVEYRKLAKKINNFCEDVSSKADKAWIRIEKEIKKYFTTDAYVYEYSSERDCTRVGYYIDPMNNKLRYFTGVGNSTIVGNFNSNDETNQKLFQKIINPGFVDAMSVGSRNMKLTPELFMHLIMHVQSETSSDPSFPLQNRKGEVVTFPVTKPLIDRIQSLQNRYKAKVINDRICRGDSETLEKKTRKLTEEIMNRAKSYLSSHATGTKADIMRAVKQYLTDGDAVKFGKAVNNGGWTAWLKGFFSWPDEADRILKKVRQMQSSPFLRESLKNLIKINTCVSAPFDFHHLSTVDTEPRNQIIVENWTKYKVTKDACLGLFKELEDIIQADKYDYPGVVLPKQIMEYDNNNDNEMFDNDGNLVPQPITTHLKALIRQKAKEVNGDNKKGRNYYEYCADVQSKILEILVVPQIKAGERRRVSQEVMAQYNALGARLCEKIATAAKDPDAKATHVVSLAKVKEEITRLENFYADLKVKLNTNIKEFDDIQQTDVSNELDNYFRIKYSNSMTLIQEASEKLSAMPDRNIDILATKDEQEKMVADYIKQLESAGSEVFDDLSRILQHKVSVGDDGKIIPPTGNEENRAFFDTRSRANGSQEYQSALNKFNDIMKNAKNHFEGNKGQAKFLIDRVTVSKTEARPAKTGEPKVASVGMFGKQETPKNNENPQQNTVNFGKNNNL